MRLADLKVGTRFWLGLGLIMLLTAVLALVSRMGVEALWTQTEGLHDHPLRVQQALADLQAEVAAADLGTKGQLLSSAPAPFPVALAELERHQAGASTQIEVLRDRYLGPQEDMDRVRALVTAWFIQRREALRLLRDGRGAEALALVEAPGAAQPTLAAVLEAIDRVEAFARARAASFYREAGEQRAALERRLLAVSAAILALSAFIAWLLVRGIRDPIVELTEAARRFRLGNMDARVGSISGSEVGELARAFNAMAEEIQADSRLRESVAALSDVLVRHGEPQAFFLHLVQALLEHTGSQVGAVHLRNSSGTAFEQIASIGLSADGRRSFPAESTEGEFGKAIATRETQRMTDVPDDTRFLVHAVTGTMVPREILTIPVADGREVTAVLSLASVRPYTPEALRFLEVTRDTVAARVNGVLAGRRTRELAERLEEQNRELDAQRRELVAQADELTEHNTELEIQKRQLDDANRLKSVFLSNMSHELRTPLNSVIALSGVLERRLDRSIGADERTYLEIIQRNGKHLLALINDILDLSRIEAGREELRVGRVPLRDLASEVLSMLEVQAQEKGVALSNRVDPELPAISSDSDKCRHILQNLAANALKFTAQGSVEISAARDGDRVRVSVTDTGIGIPADKLDLIFEEFRQADETTSRNFGGTGLGLSIARKYARLLGGDITVESTVGKGSRFTLVLPVSIGVRNLAPVPEPARPAGGSGPRAPAPAGHGQTILLVEDSEAAIIQMTDVLREDGYRVEVARNGKAALDHLARELPDALILDLMMPEVDGFQVLETLRSAPRTRHLPVIILTAKHVTVDELRALETNHVHQLIQKGDVDRSALLESVAAMLGDPARPAPAGGKPPPIVPAPTPRRAARKRPVVLVVEDNQDNLHTARAVLEGVCEVIEARDGREGVEMARQWLPDLILMDIAMPVMDGIRALAEIRKDHALREIPVYALTASAMVGDREAILAHGFDGYVSKPIDHEVLVAAVEGVLGG